MKFGRFRDAEDMACGAARLVLSVAEPLAVRLRGLGGYFFGCVEMDPCPLEFNGEGIDGSISVFLCK